MKNKELISIIVPCYNEEETILKFYYEAIEHIKKTSLNYEIIFVNDGSKDDTIGKCLQLKETDKNITIINFSRNFGKECAMMAGLKMSKGDYVAIMDADLQDPPSLLPEMLNILKEEDYDSVQTYRNTRKGEPVLRSWFANLFYRIFKFLAGFEIKNGSRDFRLMKRSVVDELNKINDKNRFIKGYYEWVGFKTKYIGYDNIKRVSGDSKWSFYKLFLYAVEAFETFSIKPLRLPLIVGLLFFVFGFIYSVILIIYNRINSLYFIIALINFFMGLILMSVGIVGEYLGRVYYESKDRPSYIIKEIL